MTRIKTSNPTGEPLVLVAMTEKEMRLAADALGDRAAVPSDRAALCRKGAIGGGARAAGSLVKQAEKLAALEKDFRRATCTG